MRLERKYEAEAAHRLTAGVPEGHQCRRPHGHRYCFVVTIIGDINPTTGMLLEYGEIDSRVWKVLALVDHNDLNALLGTNELALAARVQRNPTVENLAVWFIAELKHLFNEKRHVGGIAPQVYAVRIEEDSRSAVET